VVGAARGINLEALDPDEPELVGKAFNIATQLAREIVFVNDEAGWYGETPERRWDRVREWVVSQIKVTP
jgi:hypothetical protein